MLAKSTTSYDAFIPSPFSNCRLISLCRAAEPAFLKRPSVWAFFKMAWQHWMTKRGTFVITSPLAQILWSPEFSTSVSNIINALSRSSTSRGCPNKFLFVTSWKRRKFVNLLHETKEKCNYHRIFRRLSTTSCFFDPMFLEFNPDEAVQSAGLFNFKYMRHFCLKFTHWGGHIHTFTYTHIYFFSHTTVGKKNLFCVLFLPWVNNQNNVGKSLN